MRGLVLCLVLVSVPRSGIAAPRPTVRAQIEKAVTAGPPHRLRKLELRPTMKKIMPRLTACYERERKRDPSSDGVVNTKLTIRNAPDLGMTLSVTGFETDGKLGQSKAFLACVTRTLEAGVLSPIATLGRADVMYPLTFATAAPSERDKAIVERADRAAKAKDWASVLEAAASGLKLTSLDGPMRRHLIELGGLSACHLRDATNARRYYALASPEYEHALETACTAGAIDLTR
ncbi:MAG TPA: hypothetical protein VIU61_24845 [Kofleriaceae bacterium]